MADPPEGENLRDGEAWLESRDRRITPGAILVLVRRRNEFVEELVRELTRLRTVHAQLPHALDDRIIGPEGLGGRLHRENNGQEGRGEREPQKPAKIRRP